MENMHFYVFPFFLSTYIVFHYYEIIIYYATLEKKLHLVENLKLKLFVGPVVDEFAAKNIRNTPTRIPSVV